MSRDGCWIPPPLLVEDAADNNNCNGCCVRGNVLQGLTVSMAVVWEVLIHVGKLSTRCSYHR